MIRLLNKLTQLSGPSGGEGDVRDAIKHELKGCCDELTVDALGNLIAHKKGPGKRLMFAAHMDEIGLVVTFIEKEGFLRFAPIGGVKPHIALHRRAVFAGGVVGVVSAGEKKELKDLKLQDMFIDICAESRETAEAEIPVGSQAVFEGSFHSRHGFVTSKALDDRAGCAALIKAAQMLKSSPNDLYFVFTVQEELGLRGAKTAAFSVEPDYAFAVDVTPCGDVPDGCKTAVALGKGPAVKIKDNSVIAHPFIRGLLIETARKNGIPYQLEVLETGGTDAGAIHISRAGVPSGAISIPVRYVHSPSETASISDIEQAARLVAAVASRPM